MSKITLEEVLSVVSYNPDTGEFVRIRNSKRADTPMSIGYRRVRFTLGNKKYEFLAHRLAWFITHGYWPEYEIDHINGDREDNKLENIRDVTRTENARNTKLRVDNTSGHSGVSRHQRGWKVTVSGKYIGYSECFGKAIAMRKGAEKSMEYHKNHGRLSC